MLILLLLYNVTSYQTDNGVKMEEYVEGLI